MEKSGTGLFLCSFLVIHLAGNLLLFTGQVTYDAYAKAIHANPLFLVSAEILLYAAFARKVPRFLIVWLIVGIAVAYLPVPFQRKMLMGAHLPICLLAGVGLDALTARLSGDFPKIAALFGVLLTTPSNVLYLLADMGRLDSNSGTTARKPYLSADDQKALAWLKEHAAETDAVLVSPDPDSLKRYPGTFEPHLNAYVAGWAGVICYNGHWSETLSYPKKNGAALRFFRSDTDDETRKQLLSENHIRYVLLVNRLSGFQVEGYSAIDWTQATPLFLKAVYTGSELTIFEVSL